MPPRLEESPGPLRRALSGLTVIAALLPLGVHAFASIFSIFQPYDDEGYLLLSLKGYLSGAALYDQVYTQYGPFFYQFTSGVFSLGGFDLSHDAGRILTLTLWLSATLITSLAMLHLTRSVVVSLSVEVLSYGALGSLVNEPLHPGGLLMLLLAMTFAVVVWLLPSRRRAGFFALGACAAAATLVKVNVGAFLIVGIAFAMVRISPELARRRPLRWGLSLLLVAVPLTVTWGELGDPIVRIYAALVILGLVAILITPAPQLRDVGPQHGVWLLTGAAGASAAVIGLAFWQGTSAAGLWRGVVIDPLGQSGSFSLPLVLPSWSLVAGAAGAVLALVVRRMGPGQPRRRSGIPWAGVGRIVSGLLIWTSAATVGRLPGSPFAFSLPLAWVAALPQRTGEDDRWTAVRAMLPPVAVLQALHAFPVAGSQTTWAAFLLIPLGGICVWDGWRLLAEATGEPHGRAARVLGALPIVLFFAWLGSSLAPLVRSTFWNYERASSLRLTGATLLRIPDDQAELYRWLTAEIRGHCTSYVSLPGINSPYLFARVDPPSYLNTTAWMYLLDEERQREVVRRAERISRLCAIRNDALVAFWSQGRPVPSGPLLAYIDDAFRPLASRGGYELLIRRES